MSKGHCMIIVLVARHCLLLLAKLTKFTKNPQTFISRPENPDWANINLALLARAPLYPVTHVQCGQIDLIGLTMTLEKF